jgi:predicted RNA-binding Zn-ribbon protein involved in translation (DUF1610 family)
MSGNSTEKSPKKITVSRSGDIKMIRNSLTTWMYQCPICGKKIIHDSPSRTLMAVRQHMRLKHGLVVEVVD